MKKYISLLALLAIVLLPGTQILLANEQESGDDSREGTPKIEFKGEREEERDQIRANFGLRIETMRDKAKQEMEDLRTKIGEEKDEAKAKIKELRISGRENALGRFDQAVERMTALKERVNAKIADLEVKGVVVVDAKNFVATAETKLTDAKSKIAEINALLVVSIDELTLENKTKLRTLAQDAQTLIVAAHQALKDAVKSLRASVQVKMEAEKQNNEGENNSGNQ
jgi:hypothetical protein